MRVSTQCRSSYTSTSGRRRLPLSAIWTRVSEVRALHGLGSEAGERLVLLLGPEQVQEKGLALVGIEADLVEREAELLPHRAGSRRPR